MKMDELILMCEDFIEREYKAQLAENVRKGKNRLIISFKKILRYNDDLAEELLSNPEDTIKCFEIAVESIEGKENVDSNKFSVRIKDTPDMICSRIRDKRSSMLNKYVSFEGMIEMKSDVKMNIISAKFECPQCGNIISVLQQEKRFAEPTKCGCGRKGKFKLKDKSVVDAFTIKLQDLAELIKFDPELKSIHVIFTKDMCEPKIEERLFQGIRVKVTGYLKEVQLMNKDGGKSVTMDYILVANYVEFTENKFFNFKISEEEMKEIKSIANDSNAVEILANKVYKSIYGYDEVKKGLLLTLFGGVSDRTITPKERGEPHILLIGDPGEGKTDFLKITMLYALKSMWASGVGSSSVGLSGSVEQDKILGGFTFKAGPIVLANGGILVIDEFNELADDEKNVLREPMESGEVSINKASISRRFITQESILVSANPKLGLFDPYDDIYKQFAIPSPILSRFDLIFIFKTTHNEEFEELKANLILSRKNKTIEITPEFFKKYLSLAKEINPQISGELIKYISKKYAKLKSGVGTSGGAKMFPLTPRYVNIIKRLSEAKARIHLKNAVKKEDIDYILELIYHSLQQAQVDTGTGKVDTMALETGVTTSKRNLVTTLEKTINELAKEQKTFEFQTLIEKVLDKGDFDVDDVEKAIQKQKTAGNIFEPRNGWIGKI